MPRLQNNDDQELLSRLTSGDAVAFRALYDRYWQRLLYFASQKINGDIAEAENIVQDIFISIWERRETLTITDNRNGKQYEVPIKNDTIHAIDLRKIKINECFPKYSFKAILQNGI